MKPVLLLATAVAAAAGWAVWRTQHGPEVWHSLPAADRDVSS